MVNMVNIPDKDQTLRPIKPCMKPVGVSDFMEVLVAIK